MTNSLANHSHDYANHQGCDVKLTKPLVNQLFLPLSKFTEESFHYISANFKIIEHHDLLDVFHICICNSYLKMISIEFGILKKSFTVLKISLFKVLRFCH